MIDRIYKFIQTVSNNEIDGNITPPEYKLLLNNSVDELAEERLQELQKEVYRQKRYGRSFSIENISEKIQAKILHYYYSNNVNAVEGKYSLPADSRYIDTVEYNGIAAEPMENRRNFQLVSNFADTKPNTSYPIYLLLGNKIEIGPSELTGPISIYYLRNPKKANWTFSLVPKPGFPNELTPVFNPDANDFEDVDIHPSEEYDLTVRVLQKLGINLKAEELTQYGLTKETNDFQKDNAN